MLIKPLVLALITLMFTFNNYAGELFVEKDCWFNNFMFQYDVSKITK